MGNRLVFLHRLCGIGLPFAIGVVLSGSAYCATVDLTPQELDQIVQSNLANSLQDTLNTNPLPKGNGQLGVEADNSGYHFSINFFQKPVIEGDTISFDFDMTIRKGIFHTGPPGSPAVCGGPHECVSFKLTRDPSGNYSILPSSSLDTSSLKGLPAAIKTVELKLAKFLQDVVNRELQIKTQAVETQLAQAAAKAAQTARTLASIRDPREDPVHANPVSQPKALATQTTTGSGHPVLEARRSVAPPKPVANQPHVTPAKVISDLSELNPFDERYRTAHWTDPETGLTINGRYEIKDGQNVKDIKILNLFLSSANHMAQIIGSQGEPRFISLRALKSEITRVIADPSAASAAANGL